ncbi:unnamed protein product [Cuscuta campestris]|uniref:Leucine-rich repeat-containing N-terminal plant-type domain-containing protein n=2 Tax=Cuscuta sect. Cleistogrammica TaxID=1824901 RepID=A0A484KMG2_9ASTE|nr:hypothetical protein DM860_013214 [Cuscuta australis]VFQ65645.1 unnamed protein product [Cuscuta campestris]
MVNYILTKGIILLVITLLLPFIAAGCGCNTTTAQPATPPPPPPAVFADHRLARAHPIIQRFKKSITSDPFGVTRTWVGPDVCNYTGFFCESPPDNKSAVAIASVDFNGFRLKAPSLDGFLDQLPDIAIFHANSNYFSGTISPEVAKLPYLYELDLSNNLFSGQFPVSILGIKSLSFLDLRFNSFSGSVPPALFAMGLDALFLNNNGFTQSLPAVFSGRYYYLTLANNRFSGPVPGSVWAALSGSAEVLLLNNSFAGCLPNEIGLLEDVLMIDGSYNRLTGRLPWSLGRLRWAEVLSFAGNEMYGDVPEAVCALGNLVSLSLADNYFSRVGPVCLGLIVRGVLDVRNNCIPGMPFQRPISDCLDFFSSPRYCRQTFS